jgi:hypothetical protein
LYSPIRLRTNKKLQESKAGFEALRPGRRNPYCLAESRPDYCRSTSPPSKLELNLGLLLFSVEVSGNAVSVNFFRSARSLRKNDIFFTLWMIDLVIEHIWGLIARELKTHLV